MPMLIMAYSVYADPNSVYYKGNKGYMGDSEGLV